MVSGHACLRGAVLAFIVGLIIFQSATFAAPPQTEFELPGQPNVFPVGVNSGADPIGEELLVPPAVAANTTVSQADLEARLEALESGWKKLDKAWEKFEASQAKKKADAAAKPTFNIGGRIHADIWDFVQNSDGIGFFEHSDPSSASYGTDPEDRFKFRRIRLEMKGDILEDMLWRVQVDFAEPEEPQIKDVYLGFKHLPLNQKLLIGNQKRPYGLDHLNSSRFNVFLERPYIIEAYNQDSRRPGIMMYGFSDDKVFNWRYGAFYLENAAKTGKVIGDARQMSLNARLASSPWYDDASGGRNYLHWAISGMYARPDGNPSSGDSNSNEAEYRSRPEARSSSRWLDTGSIAGASDFEIIGLESIFNAGPLQVTAEFQQNWTQRNQYQDVQFHGAYVYLSYVLTGEHIPYDRETGTLGRLKPFKNFFASEHCRGQCDTGWGAWTVAIRYSYADLTDGDIQGGVGESWTTALNWHWNPYARVQFNAIYGDIDKHAPVGGYTAGNYVILGTRFAVDF